MHCRTHSGTKPFKCQTCQTAFAQLGNLKKHLKRWHDPISGAVPKRKGKKKAKEKKNEAVPANEGANEAAIQAVIESADQAANEVVEDVSQMRSENEAVESKDAGEPGESNENSVEHDSEAEEDNNNSQNNEELMRREETAIASILTSITSDQNFNNTRGFTPLNTPTQGFYISPLNSALTNVGPSVSRPSIIMTSMSTISSSVTVPAVMSQMQPNMEPSSSAHTQLAPVFVPPTLGPFMTMAPPSVVPQITSSGARPPITSVVTSSTSSTSTILPHVHTILAPQINPQHFVPHTTVNQVQTTDIPMYPFSPSSLFQH